MERIASTFERDGKRYEVYVQQIDISTLYDDGPIYIDGIKGVREVEEQPNATST